MATSISSATCAALHSMPERAECELLHNHRNRDGSVGRAARAAKNPLVQVESHKDIRPLQFYK